ncbi:MAG TPA: GSCFA domain-containing protein [Pseudolabrys sp.]|jgi:hypothetical protein|nr:GSCFA domain-containing protein [Pseudolabrys sp.]
MFEIASTHRKKWDATRGRRQPITLVPVARGALKGKRIFTMGSCFALEIRHQMAALGFDTYPKYFDIAVDPSQAMIGKLPMRDNINHYNISSILQEFENIERPVILPDYFIDLSRYDSFAKHLRLFVRTIRKGLEGNERRFTARWQDPFRKQCYSTQRDILASLSSAVTEKIREGAAKADIFIFTLGMTETWVDKVSGLTVCNSYGAQVDEELFDFVDLSIADTTAKIDRLISLVRTINPDADIIFTVSPIPLERTAKNESVVVANAGSKAKQRGAISEIVAKHDGVFYFPSYEFAQRPEFYTDDGRHPAPAEVGEIIKAFMGWYEG